jgi:hypothetical protein
MAIVIRYTFYAVSLYATIRSNAIPTITRLTCTSIVTKIQIKRHICLQGLYNV